MNYFKQVLKITAGVTLILGTNVIKPVEAVTIIDFEGFAPPGGIANTSNSTLTFNNFDLYTSNGYIQSKTSPLVMDGTRADSGSDWILHAAIGDPIVITNNQEIPFSLESFRASEPYLTAPRNLVLTVEGLLLGGGSLTTTLITDSTFGFETFNFDSSWTNLTEVRITPSDLKDQGGAYDDIVVSANNVSTPEPLTILGTATVLGFGVLFKKKKVNKG